jgi:hypothetical protein
LRPTSTIHSTSDIQHSTTTKQKKRWEEIFDTTIKTKEANYKSTTNFTKLKLKPNSDSNLPFGNDIHEIYDSDKIIFHNINGLKDDTNWLQILKTMMELRADIFGFVELNRTMEHGRNTQVDGSHQKTVLLQSYSILREQGTTGLSLQTGRNYDDGHRSLAITDCRKRTGR